MKGKLLPLLFIIGAVLLLINPAEAQLTDLDSYTIQLPGDQLQPYVWGSYIVYTQDGDIWVYDSGNTIAKEDDRGAIRITTDGATKRYSNPIIHKQYIAWLNEPNGIYVYDMGEDLLVNWKTEADTKIAIDSAIKNLEIEDIITDPNPENSRRYTKKTNLAISEGILVWQDYDELHKDTDIRGYDLSKDELLVISDEKENEFGTQINEADPDIAKGAVVFTKNYQFDDEGFVTDPIPEVFKYRIGSDQPLEPVSDLYDAFEAYEPAIDKDNPENVVWVESSAGSFYRVMDNLRGEVTDDRTSFYYLHPHISFGTLIYISEEITTGLVKLHIEKESTGIVIPNSRLNVDKYRAVYTVDSSVGGLGYDIGIFAITRKMPDWGSERPVSISMIPDKKGGFIIVWHEPSLLNSLLDIYIARIKIDQAGKVTLLDKKLVSQEIGWDINPQIVDDGLGGFIVVWERRDKFLRHKIYLARVVLNSDGSLNVLEQKLLCNCPVTQASPYVVSDKNGNILIVWIDSRNRNTDIRMAKIITTPDGKLSVSNERVLPIPKFPALASDGRGGFIAAWTEFVYGGMDIYASRITIDENGEIKIASRIPVCIGKGVGRGSLFILTDRENGAILTWLDSRDAYGNIYGARIVIEQDGTLKSLGEQAIYNEDATPFSHSSAMSDNENLFMVWLENGGVFGSELYGGEIYFDSKGKMRLIKKIPISVGLGYVSQPTIVNAGGDKFFMIWEKREGSIVTGIGAAMIILNSNDIITVTTFPDLDLLSFLDSNFPNAQAIVFIRGDIDGDGLITMGDSQALAAFLNGQADPPEVLDTADVNDDGEINRKDLDDLLAAISGTFRIPPPFPEAGIDPTPDDIDDIKLFIRGDVNEDGRIDMGDAIFILNSIFAGGSSPSCLDSADVDDDGRITIGDAIYLLNYMFSGGPEPKPPFPEPGIDITEDTLACGGRK